MTHQASLRAERMGIRCIRNFCLRSEEAARHATDGQPDGDETDEEDGEEGEKEVGGLNADGVGIDDKGAFAGTQLDKAIANLKPTDKQACTDADGSADAGDKPAFEEENLADLRVVGT